MADYFDDFEPIQRPNYEDPAAYARDMDYMRDEVQRTGPQFDELRTQMEREQRGELGKQPLSELLGETAASYIRVSPEMHKAIDQAIEEAARKASPSAAAGVKAAAQDSAAPDGTHGKADQAPGKAAASESGKEPERETEKAASAVSGKSTTSDPSTEAAAANGTAQVQQSSQHAQENTVAFKESLNAAGLGAEHEFGAAPLGAPGDSSEVAGKPGRQGVEPAPEKPTDVESLLAATPVSNRRQSRFVMTGDPDIIKAVELKLQARGLMSIAGGQKIISASDRQLNKVMDEVVKGFDGASVNRALNLEFPREGAGLVGSARAGLDNFFGRRDSVSVVVLGAQSHQEAKAEELGKLVSDLRGKDFFKGEEKLKATAGLSSDDKLVTDGKTPLQLRGNKNLSDLVIMASSVTEPYRRHKAMEHETRNDLRKSREDQDLVQKAENGAAPKAKEFGGLSADGKERIQEAEGLLRGGQAKLYEEIPGKGVTAAKRSLGFMTALKPNELTEVSPQRAESYLAAMSGILAKELESPSFKMKETTPGAFQSHLAAMREKDPESVGRMQQLVSSLVQDGALTQKQGEFAAKALATGELDRGLLADKGSAQKSDNAAEAASAAATAATPKDAQPRAVEGLAQAAAVRTEPAEPVAASQASIKASRAASGERVEPSLSGATAADAAPSPTLTQANAKGLAADLERIGQAGEGALSPVKAEALLGAVSDLRGAKLSALDSREGAGPSETLARLDRVLETIQKGNYPEHLVIQAEELGKTAARWKQEDHKRQGGGAVAADRIEQAREAVAVAEPGWASGATVATAEKAASLTQELGAAKDGTRSETVASVSTEARKAEAPAQPSLADTQRAVRSLHMDMQWPPRTFTTQDKQWDEGAVQKFAEKVANLDPDKVAQLPAEDRKGMAAYAAWLVDSAASGKLPGFNSEQGKALLQRATDTGLKLINNLEPGSTLPEGLAKRVAHAEGMADQMVAREKNMGASADLAERRADAPGQASQGAAAQSLKGQDLSRYAKDLAHSVFESGGMTEQHAIRLLKVSAEFTPESLKTLDPQTKARAVTGMEELAKAVKAGDLGNFERLPAEVRNSTLKALNTADKLHDVLAKEPGMSTELIKARIDLAKDPVQDVKQAAGENAHKASDTLKAPTTRQAEGRVRE